MRTSQSKPTLLQRRTWSALVVLPLALSAGACDSKTAATATKEDAGKSEPAPKAPAVAAKAASAKTAEAEPPTPTPTAAAEDPLALTQVTPEGFWPIMVPKGAKEGVKIDTMVTYGMEDGDLNLQVKVFRGGGQKSIAKAKKWADLEMAGSEIVEATKVAKGVFQVVMDRKSDNIETVVMYNKDDRMVCYGKTVELSLLKAICSSFPGAPAATDVASADSAAAEDESTAAASGTTVHHCDLIKPISTCFQWELAADAVAPKQEFCEGSRGKFVEGACPAEGDLGTCVLRGDKDIHYYKKKFKPASAEQECTAARSGAWTATP